MVPIGSIWLVNFAAGIPSAVKIKGVDSKTWDAISITVPNHEAFAMPYTQRPDSRSPRMKVYSSDEIYALHDGRHLLASGVRMKVAKFHDLPG